MGVEIVDESRMETVITRVTVINPSPTPVSLPTKYRGLFHGVSALPYGRHVFRFPITHMGYKRLVSSFQAQFVGRLRVDYGSAGFDEV